MIVRESKLIKGTKEQYQAFDDAIRTAEFIRNKAARYWMDNRNVGKVDLYTAFFKFMNYSILYNRKMLYNLISFTF